MSGKIPVRIVSDGDGSGTLHRVGVDFGRNHNFEVVTAADQRAGGHIPMTQAVANALGIVTASFPLDGITTPDLAISTARRLRSGYTGSLLRVVNASAVEADIGYNGSNELDTAALLAHTGTGGSDTGSIIRAYGQAGTIDGYQGTSGNRPWIVQAGAINTMETKPACKPQTAGAGLNTVTQSTTTPVNLHGAIGDFSWLIVVIGPTASFARDFFRLTAPGMQIYTMTSTTKFRHDVGVTIVETANGVNDPGTTARVYAGYRSGSTVEAFRNNEGTALPTTGSTSTAFVASQYTMFSGSTDRTYAEMYWWNSAIPLDELNALRANCTTFYGATYP